MKKTLYIAAFLAAFSWSSPALAQEEVAAVDINEDDLGNVSDDFKENFFNALSAKAIGNHDKAINYLEACEKMQPDNGAIQFELGKNYLMSDAFAKAEQKIQRAIELEGEREPILETLYDIYDKQKDYEKSIVIMEKLAARDANYEELLPYQYARLEKNDKALAIIEKLDKRLGEDPRREFLKRQILARTNQQEKNSSSITELEQRIAADPKDEQAYINLMYLYSQEDNTAKIIETAAAMEDNIAGSEKAHLALYKIYLENGEIRKGVRSMEKVFRSSIFDTQTKINVLNDFIKTGATDPEVYAEIQDAIDEFADEVEDAAAFKALGDFYLNKKQPEQAISFYEKGIELDDKNYDLIKNVALLSLDMKDYKKTVQVTEDALDIFPAQALLYLLNGVAHNNLDQPDKAIDQLETGLSFLLDEPKLESDIYQQLAVSYDKKADATKAAKMRSKVKQLSKKL